MIESRFGLRFWRGREKVVQGGDIVKGLKCRMVRVENVERWTYSVALRLRMFED